MFVCTYRCAGWTRKSGSLLVKQMPASEGNIVTHDGIINDVFVAQLMMKAVADRGRQILFCFLPDYIIMATLCNRGAIIFLPCNFYLLLSIFFSSPNLSGHRLDVYCTLTHGVALVQI